ncbi:beta strand repeat-containing protein [Pseudomonas sp. GM60]|uniref:beta strand repeat-containing protein n=1 Tax=Pseudomonas sp. GM60 TaxID=1144334 RepID=UPI000270658E|nr:filamentous hemagglutinin N-terminal domain-containing protein [Pseudomonas sp. GM60]EJM88570.1 filamentous hemagglutinin family N-terminal domain-containing protein [Pseudomonas sp. GM60]
MSNVRSKRNSRETLPRLKPLSHAVLCALYSLAPLPALALDSNALPTNGQVVAGSASISSNGNVMTVNQGSDRMIATWNTFNVGSGAQVNFQQPGTSSVALNRVTGSDGSQILGQLNANGQVFLINPSGVLFGAGSMVSVGGLVASSLDISNSDFLAGRTVFSGKSQGAVINQGVITAGDGGSVALLGAQVRNEGTVVARLGSVVLGGGEKITLDLKGDGLINLEVNDPAIGASVVNRGLLRANGGLVALSARDSQAMLSNVVNNEGVIEARSLQQRNGRIVLDGGNNGVVVNSGTLDASGRNSGERGGDVSLTGEYVGLFDSGRINADGDVAGGTVLLGGDYQGSGGVHQATATYMDSDARISADALSNGNGGKVILWSLDSTQFHGGISVKGAGNQGRGGLVETSGHALEVTGIVDLSAVSGQGGTWLIDPFNINITAGASSGATSTSPFTSSGAASSNLSSATLNASLSEGANILVCTSSVGGTSGDINVLDNVRGVGNATLTLQAHRNIVMTNTSISNGTGKTLNVSLYSNYNNTGNGSVALTNATISTNGGNLTVSGAVQPNQSWASTNVSNGSGISLSNGTRITTSGGNVVLRGATSSTLAAGSTATAVSIRGSSIDAGGGNISITALQASTSGTGDAFVLTGGSSLLTTGIGSITVDGTNLGSGNATRIFSGNNSIATTGSGDVTLRGNASSGYGVLVCATAASSSQSLSVGTGTLTVQGNGNVFAGTGRGVYLAASGDGQVNLTSAQGGDIVLNGSSTASYGTILNSTGATSSINLTTDGDITLSGLAAGGTTPALALVTSGNGTATTPGAGINIVSSSGDVRLKANQNTVNTAGGAFRGLSLDAGGAYSTIRIATQSGDLALDGSSVSGRGVEIAPSGTDASISLATTSGDININGNSTGSLAGYGIFFNATGSAQGVNVSSGAGNITLRGNSLGASDAVVLGGSAGNQLTTQGGNLTISGVVQPSPSSTSTNLSNGSGISLGSGTLIATHGGDVSLTGATSSTLAPGSTATGVNIRGSSIDAGGGNINITALQASIGGIGDAFVLTGGSRLLTTGIGSITVDSTNLGSGNATRIFGTNNSIAASGSGDVTLRGNAVSGYGVLVCSTAASSAQSLSVGTGTLTMQGNGNGFGGTGRGVYLAASGDGAINLSSAQGGDIVLDGSSTGSYGTILNSTGATSSINLATDGNITLTGTTMDGTTPALALIASGDGTASTSGASINVDSSRGDVLLKANHKTVSTSSGSFKALSLDAGGDYSAIRISTNSGDLTLDGTSVSGRGVDIAPSGANASIDLSTTSGDINISGNSTTPFGGYGIFFNSTGNSQGVNVSSGSGNITLRGDSVGTSDAIALGGSTGNGVSSNRITSQGGDISLIGNFHSPNSGELDHGIAILAVNNILQTRADGNLTLIGNASDFGSGVEVYGNGKAQLSVENGALSIHGSSGAGDGIGLLTGQNLIQATGSGSVSLVGQSQGGVGINIYPSGSSSSLTLSTVSGDLSLTGTSAATSTGAGLSIRSGASGPANGVKILSSTGDIRLSGTAQGSGDGIAFSASSANGYNSVVTGGDGNLSLIGRSAGGAALSFDDGNNSLQVADGLLMVDVDTPTGRYITHTDDSTSLSANGSGAVVISRGGLINSSLLDAATAPTTQYLQMQMARSVWSQPLTPDYHLTAMGSVADQVNIEVAQWRDLAAADTTGPRPSSKTERE